MPLVSGAQIGPYTIGEEVGSGGMGVVYRATDTNLKRDVAIKALPESLATDTERMARFQREAEVLASLNHPNIAQIYGLEKTDGATALIMELVDGETLADRIEKGPLPPDEALGIAMQIADALEAAHSQNIVHRDLKPANVKLKSDGTVKVLDFGIAKALDPENFTSGAQSPMLTTPATQVGVILGTAAYMSPEQARGKAVDERADIWAFGCVLYEMLTGQPAFLGEDVPITLARVLANDTDMESLPNTISPTVRQAIQLCLQKDLRKRVADIRDVRLALEGAFEAVSPQDAEVRSTAYAMWSRPLPVAAAALIVGGILTGLAVWVATRPEPPYVTRFDYDLPGDQVFDNTTRRLMALSPDGRQFVYDTGGGLYLRTMDELEARLVPGTEPGLFAPAFSPDGRAVAYLEFPSLQLKRIAVSGGAPVVIADMPDNPSGPSWAVDGTVLLSSAAGILRVAGNGGTPEVIIPAEDPILFYGPQLLPDGDSVLFSVGLQAQWDAAQIVVQSLSTGERTVLIEGGSDARYLPTGHLVYALEYGLFAVAFDLDTLIVSGGVVPVVQGVMRAFSGSTASANYGVSENGTLAYVPGFDVDVNRTLVWVDREGRETPLTAPPRAYTYPRISPDGTKVALDVRDQEFDIWTWDFARETLTRLTFDPGQDEFPVWSPDGQQIAFSLQGGTGNPAAVSVFLRASDGTGQEQLLAVSDNQLFPTSFLPDGTGLLARTAPSGDDSIAIVGLEGEDNVTLLLVTTFNELNAEISPDGRWMAYTSDESGSDEIYVRPFPDVNAGRWQVSVDGGRQPLWARDGRELFYRNGEAVMAVSIETDPGFSQGNPDMVFEAPYFGAGAGRSYDVSSDGERFLMIKNVEGSAATHQIIIVENWFEELKRLAPTE